jgi:hypothetical protein
LAPQFAQLRQGFLYRYKASLSSMSIGNSKCTLSRFLRDAVLVAAQTGAEHDVLGHAEFSEQAAAFGATDAAAEDLMCGHWMLGRSPV